MDGTAGRAAANGASVDLVPRRQGPGASQGTASNRACHHCATEKGPAFHPNTPHLFPNRNLTSTLASPTRIKSASSSPHFGRCLESTQKTVRSLSA